MEKIYNIRCIYPFYGIYGQGISSSSSRYCKITQLNEHSWHYSFEDAFHWYQRWDYREPLLRVEELRDPMGQLTHLRFVIDDWDGSNRAKIVIGSNQLPIVEMAELESPPARNIGLSRVLWIGQIEEPYITIPELPAPSWWSRIGTLGHGVVIGGILFTTGLVAWKLKK